MKYAKAAGALCLFAAGMGLWLLGDVGLDTRLAQMTPQLDKKLQEREIHIDAAELFDLLHNNQLAKVLWDVRDEADYNLFHLIDARRVTIDDLRQPWVRKLPAATIKVVMANDEARANAAWRLLSAQKVENVYVLDGGVNAWLDLYAGATTMPVSGVTVGSDRLRHRFDRAFGASHPASDPDAFRSPKRAYTAKVKMKKGRAMEGGGCG